MSPTVNQSIKASLLLVLAIFVLGCSSLAPSNPTWHKPYKLESLPKAQEPIAKPVLLDSVCMFVEEAPSYPGGASAWRSYTQASQKSSANAKQWASKGNVILGFTVTKDGSVVNISVLRGSSQKANEEAIKLLVGSGKWIPGKQNGSPVNARTSMRIVL